MLIDFVISDIQEFCQQANEYYQNYSQIIGPWYPGQSDGESTLDVEYLMSMGSKGIIFSLISFFLFI
jgi:hypothetical protein